MESKVILTYGKESKMINKPRDLNELIITTKSLFKDLPPAFNFYGEDKNKANIACIGCHSDNVK
jgi:hypothetical protein